MKHTFQKLIAVLAAQAVCTGMVCPIPTRQSKSELPVSAAQEGIAINEEFFPDEAFRIYVSDIFDTEKDGVLTEKEIAAVTELSLGREVFQESDEAPLIYTLSGIEHFTALQSLDCSNQKITFLDVSALTALERLQCSGTDLTFLDVSGLTKLVYLDVNNAELDNLILDGCTSLQKLYCNSNRLISLDTKDCTELTDLCCAYNQLTTLDVRHLKNLQYLSCDHNNLAGLDLSKNEKLEMLNAHQNRSMVHTSEPTVDLSILPADFDAAKVVEWTNASVSDTMLTVKDMQQSVTYSYDLGNGMTETFILCIADPYPADNLPKGATRVTLYDRQTGKLVPNAPLAQNRWGFGANIGIKNPNVPGGLIHSGPLYTIDSNPCIVDKEQLASLFSSADIFEVSGLKNGEQPQYIPHENGSLDMLFYVDYNYAVVKWIDEDTNEEITFSQDVELKAIPYRDNLYERYYTISDNPNYLPYDFYDWKYDYSLDMASSAGAYTFRGFALEDEVSNVKYYNGYVKWKARGDANGDGEFGILDALALQKWLLGKADAGFANWNAVDFCRDGKLDGFDMALLKKKLLEKPYLEPEVEVQYGAPFITLVDGLKLYAAPDLGAEVVGTVPEHMRLFERGYQKNNDDWVFTVYGGQHGWLKIYDENGDMTLMFEVYEDKPVIYLYPEEETEVHVELELTESELATTYPKYNNGWDVVAYPDGTLLNKADGSHHKYLFWDAKNCRTRFDFSRGFCIAGEDTEAFLKEKLTYMGLNEQEMNEFIVYWLPLMERNAYNLITFQEEAYTDAAKLHITPTPDSLCRIFMVYVPLDSPVEIAPQELTAFERKGFTVVEWGGTAMPEE